MADDRLRPHGVPADAIWLGDSWGEWGHGRREGDGIIGDWRFWRPDGTFSGDATFTSNAYFRDQTLNGERRYYHTDGSLARVYVFRDGHLVCDVHYRQQGSSDEGAFAGLATSIQKLEFRFDGSRVDDAYVCTTQLFHSADGTELDSHGKPVPTRPLGLSPTAQFNSSIRLWRDGRWVASGASAGRGLGLFHFYDPSGVLVRWDYKGEQSAAYDLRDGENRFGDPLIAAAKAGDTEAVRNLLAAGHGRHAATTLHAAYEQVSGFLRECGRTVDVTTLPSGAPSPGRAEPERPDTVPADAVWVGGLGSGFWICGDVDATGAAAGTWRLWKASGSDFDPEAVRAVFVDGRLRERHEMLSGDTPYREFHFGPDGVETLRRTYDLGWLEAETEQCGDGQQVYRSFFDHTGGVMMERITHAGQLIIERWFDQNETLTAEVTPVSEPLRRKNKGDLKVELWRALNQDGATTALGYVRAGDGGPVKKWRLFGSDGNERATVSLKKLDLQRNGDLGAMAAAVELWRRTPRPAVLAEMDAVPWGKLEGWGFVDTTMIPFFLHGLVVPDPTAVRIALDRIEVETLHQHTISDIAGPAVRFMTAACAVIDDRDSLAGVLQLICDIATRNGEFSAASFLLRLYASTPPNKSKAAKHYRRNDTEPAYYEIYAAINSSADLWISLSSDDNEAVRGGAQVLRALVVDDVARAAELAAAANEPSRHLRAGVVLSLACRAALLAVADPNRWGDDPELINSLNPMISSDADPLIRFCAALTWLRSGLEPIDCAVSVVLDVLHGRFDPEGFDCLYLGSGSAITDAIGCLREVPLSYATPILPQLCQALEDVDPINAISVASALLDIVFPDEAHKESRPFTQAQRTVVGAIADSPNAWLFNANLSEVLTDNGLPSDRKQLRALATHSQP